mgnify:CR=1 FL=1
MWCCMSNALHTAPPTLRCWRFDTPIAASDAARAAATAA